MRKNAFLVMAGLAVATLTAGQVTAAPRPTQAVSNQDLVPAVPAWDDVVAALLYSQVDNPGTVSLNSQNFEAAYDAYDNTAADDFLVPKNVKWSINGVAATGVYFNGLGPANSFNVVFYQDAGNKPGAAGPTRTNQTYSNVGGEFRIKISPAVNIPGGANGRHVWMSVQANLDFGVGGQWGWTDRTTTNNSPANWQNPGGGFAVCPSWDVFDNCFGGLNDGDDLLFRLKGSVI